MKKILLIICAGMLTLASCMDNFDAESVSTTQFTAKELPAPTTTISQVRKAYSKDITNNTYQQIQNDEVFDGIVVANDVSGNIYQTIYLQGLNEDGTLNTKEGGIAINIKGIACLYTIFPVGQKVRVNLKNLYVGGYGASPRVGLPYVNTNGAIKLGPMTLPYLSTNIEVIGEPKPELVIAREVTGAELNNADNLSALTPMLVVLNNAEISDAGWPYAHWEVGGDIYSEYHDITINGTKVRQLLYTSTSATFAGDTIKAGKKTIYGLLSRYSSSPQLSLRSLDDIVER